MKEFLSLVHRQIGSRSRFLLILTALASVPAMAELASLDVTGTARATPQATIGALEYSAPAAPVLPAVPQGVSLSMQQVTL